MLSLLEFDDAGDGSREAAPVGGFAVEGTATKSRQRVELGAAVVFALAPLRLDPALLFELMQSGVKRAIAYLQHIAGDLLQANGYGETVEGFESKNFQEQEVESALHEVRRFGHIAPFLFALDFANH